MASALCWGYSSSPMSGSLDSRKLSCRTRETNRSMLVAHGLVHFARRDGRPTRGRPRGRTDPEQRPRTGPAACCTPLDDVERRRPVAERRHAAPNRALSPGDRTPASGLMACHAIALRGERQACRQDGAVGADGLVKISTPVAWVRVQLGTRNGSTEYRQLRTGKGKKSGHFGR